MAWRGTFGGGRQREAKGRTKTGPTLGHPQKKGGPLDESLGSADGNGGSRKKASRRSAANPGDGQQGIDAGILHFAIGPVQSFVAEARRTRDLWAGSFLLSWLSGHAMVAAIDEGGKIVFPHVDDDPLFEAIRQSVEDGEVQKPTDDYQPSLTNRFIVRFDPPVNGDEAAARIAERVHDKWHAVANAVWNEFLEGKVTPEQRNLTKKIWDRQIGALEQPFWEITWAYGGDETDPQEHHLWLDRAKRWRQFDHVPPEPGDLCRMMGYYQELSGIEGMSQDDRESRKDFWETIQEAVKATLKEGYDKNAKLLELRRSEHLCAVAFVKRMFPRLKGTTLRQTIGWLPKEIDPASTRLPMSYRPSTAFMAAAHWLARLGHTDESTRNAFRDAVKENASRVLQVSERAQKLPCHDSLRPPDDSPSRQVVLPEIDGRLYYQSTLRTKDKEADKTQDNEDNETNGYEPGVEKPGPILNALKKLYGEDISASVKTRERYGEDAPGAPSEIKVGEPSPYYALLRMDGDRIGKKIADADAQGVMDALAERLAQFSKSASDVVKANNGSVIFAGGDDLLAMLPLEDVLPVANEIRKDFNNNWPKELSEAGITAPTLSGAIVFAHYEVPLGWVMRRSRALLEDNAKEENGRDSLAISVLRTGGEGLNWVSSWEIRPAQQRQSGDGGTDHVDEDAPSPSADPVEIAEVAQEIARRAQPYLLASSATKPERSLRPLASNRFVYGVGTGLSAFFHAGRCRKGSPALADDDAALCGLLKAAGGPACAAIPDDEFKSLLKILRPHRRAAPDKTHTEPNSSVLSLDGLLLLRFLASEWRRIGTE